MERPPSRPLRISFDLDDTLICVGNVPAEPRLALWRRWIYPEPLRRGAVSLMHALRQRGWEIWIYTTSYRSPRSIRGWLRSYRIAVSGIVTQTDHDRIVGRQGPSKSPPHFGIDLHIDDSEGVRLEGERLGFATFIVSPHDPDWAERVLRYVDEIIATEPSGERLG